MNKNLDLNDLREVKSTIKGHVITAGVNLDENNVKMMLTRMAVEPTPEIVSEAIGYMSEHGAEITMNNLGDFLKIKGIISGSISTIDMRTAKKK